MINAKKGVTMFNGALGIQSYCFRKFQPVEQLIEKVVACGLSGVELFKVHADYRGDAAKTREVIDALKRAGIGIFGVGVERFTGVDQDEKIFEWAQYADASFISADFNLENHWAVFEKVSAWADRYQVNVGIHNHGGRHWLGALPAMKYALANSGKRLGLCLDTAWALDAHQDPLQIVAELSDRVYAIHLKDFVFDRAGKSKDTILGEGNLDLPGLIGLLGEKNFQGKWIIEYEGNPDDPVEEIRRCVAAVRA